MKYIYLSLALSVTLISCNSSLSKEDKIHTADIRKMIDSPATTQLADEIESVSYVPLKLTLDDGSVIDGILHYTVSEDAIYIYPSRERRIIEFDRKGNYVRELISEGQGPGELSRDITSLQVDSENKRLYLHTIDQTMVYNLDGKLIEEFSPAYQNIYKHQIGRDRIAAVAFPYVPFSKGSYGIGIFSQNGDTIEIKNNFSSSVVEPEKRGLTIRMAVDYSNNPAGILFKQGSNDTVFSLSPEGIIPACVLSLNNSTDEIKRSLDATDMSSIRNLGNNNDIIVSDLFETPASYYFRMRYNEGHYIMAMDKKTGQSAIEKCIQPASLQELASISIQHGMLGSRSFRNFPIWGRTENNELIQVVLPSEIEMYNETGNITVPEELTSIENDDNPIFIFYKLKH